MDSLFSQGVFCWDIRRLIFYSIKVRTCYELTNNGPVNEFKLGNKVKGSYLRQTGRRTDGMMVVNICVFIDDHNKEFLIGYEEIRHILTTIYEKTIKNIIESTQFDIQANIKFYILCIADEEDVSSSYSDYVANHRIHPRMQLFPKFKMFQFGAAPWMAIY